MIERNIIFDRKLKDGAGDELYGLEIAKHLGLSIKFIENAFDIRNELIGKKKTLLSTKKSKYNTKKLVDSCEICKYYPKNSKELNLDTHHINFQCNADNYGFIENTFHKNEKFNLVILCKECHQKVHRNKITIIGYYDSSKGTELDYTIN